MTAADIDVLLVEDNPDDADMTLRALGKANIVNHVRVARDGAEALAFIFGADTGFDLGSLPRLVLLDLKLPKIDGFEVLRLLKGDPRTKAIPVVILTSSAEQRDVAEGYQLGVNSYIVKPVTFEGFAEAVGRVGLYWVLLNQRPR